MNNKISFFLPTRKGSERVKNKNTRPFANIEGLSSTNLQDLICYVPTITDATHILWGHVTTPLTDAEQYDNGIKLYLDNLHKGYDSLVGVNELKNFLLDTNGKLINNTTSLPWPRTQDLTPLYEINHTMFLAKREVYIEQKNRIGQKPLLHVMDNFTV